MNSRTHSDVLGRLSQALVNWKFFTLSHADVLDSNWKKHILKEKHRFLKHGAKDTDHVLCVGENLHDTDVAHRYRPLFACRTPHTHGHDNNGGTVPDRMFRCILSWPRHFDFTHTQRFPWLCWVLRTSHQRTQMRSRCEQRENEIDKVYPFLSGNIGSWNIIVYLRNVSQ